MSDAGINTRSFRGLRALRVQCGQGLPGRLLAGFLALCLALGGWTGSSPALHRWLEHGGMGKVHTHGFGGGVDSRRAGDLLVAHAHDHQHGRRSPLTHVHPVAPAEVDARPVHWGGGVLARGRSSFPTPAEILAGIRQLLTLASEGSGEAFPTGGSSDASDTDPGHEHHSLVTLLDQGLVDQADGFIPLIIPPPPVAWRASLAEPGPRVPDFGRALSDRGPPVSSSRS